MPRKIFPCRSDSPAVDGFCCAAVSLELRWSRSTLTPLLVSIEEDLGIGHAQATSLLMQSAGFSSALAASGFLLCASNRGRSRPSHWPSPGVSFC